MPFLIGAIGIVLLILLFRIGITTEPKKLARFARYTAIAVLGGLAIFLGVTERWVPAVFLGGVVWALLQGVTLWPAGRPDEASDTPRAQQSTSTLSRAEALRVLGLQEGASDEDIRAAHRKLILQNHPDKGGSDYLASKINEAKDVLLGS
ncbi:MAG: DnaJ domain-containing protein [Rhizomicrobium sp.]